MSGQSQAAQWDEIASHLVQAHGAAPDRLTSYVLGLAQLRWAHYDTHAALKIVGMGPPDGHAHPAGLKVDWEWRKSQYSPFGHSPAADRDDGYMLDVGVLGRPDPRYTGLPHTLVVPPDLEPYPTDPAGWAREALDAYRRPWPGHSEQGALQAEDAVRGRIRTAASAAAARQRAIASFPAGPAGRGIAVAAAAASPQPARKAMRRGQRR